MTTKHQWLEFLKTQQAIIENEKILRFANTEPVIAPLDDQTIIAPLDDYGAIAVAGEENSGFLQNQFSNDVRLVTESHSQLNAYCSAKGRVLSLMRVIKQQDCYYLLLPKERLPATLNRLKMFVLRSKVTLEEASDSMGVIGIAGANADALLTHIVSSLPEQADECIYNNQVSAVKLAGPLNRYLLFAPYAALMTIWTQYKQDAIAVSTQTWSYLDIQAGVPEVYDANSDEFVPQMLNLHSLNGISFTKGCYPGQEVVARMHYLGKQKRRMYLAHVDSDSAPQPGENLYSDQNESGQSVGKIVSASPAPQGGYEVLAVMQIASVESHNNIYTPQKAALDLKELPYSVEVEGKK
jgi:folate-binding protein YgfZ